MTDLSSLLAQLRSLREKSRGYETDERGWPVASERCKRSITAEEWDYFIFMDSALPTLLAELEALELVRASARVLVAKLDEVGASDEYVSVFFQATNHNMPYTGPTYDAELAALRRLAATDSREETE